MRRKSLRIFLFTLALALLLVSSSTAYADAVSISTVSLSNLQIVPTVGTIQFGLPGSTAIARATNSFGDVDERPAPGQTTPQANARSADAQLGLQGIPMVRTRFLQIVECPHQRRPKG